MTKVGEFLGLGHRDRLILKKVRMSPLSWALCASSHIECTDMAPSLAIDFLAAEALALKIAAS